MGKDQPALQRVSQPPKLARLPKNARIQKRPLLHPSIPSARAGAHLKKVVYISFKTPFISTIKHVNKYLDEVNKRSMGKIDLLGPGADREKIESLGRGREAMGEEVLVKATGRAIEKALHVALFYQARPDCLVRLRTGCVGAVDDVVVDESPEGAGEMQAGDGGVDLPETQIRRTSMLEVAISLR